MLSSSGQSCIQPHPAGTLELRFPKGTKVWKLDSPKDKLSGTDTRGVTRWIYKVQRLRLSGGGGTGDSIQTLVSVEESKENERHAVIAGFLQWPSIAIAALNIAGTQGVGYF